MKKLLPLILILGAIIMILAGCSNDNLPTLTAEEKLQFLTEKFEERGSLKITGTTYRDGQLETKISGAIDDTAKKIRLDINGTEYLYFNKYLLKESEKGYEVDKSSTSFIETLKFLPFSIYSFTYNEKRRESIDASSNLITISFYDRGVKDTFQTSANISGGVFAIRFEGDKITDTTLTTKLTENGKTYTYSVHYSYGSAEKTFDGVPKVQATDTANYAIFAINAIYSNHGEQFLHIVGTDFNTGNPLLALIAHQELISSVYTVVVLENGNRTLRIEFSTPVDVPYITSYVKYFEITFSEDYYLSGYIQINGGSTKLYLK